MTEPSPAAVPQRPMVELTGLAKSFGQHRVLDGVSLRIEDGEFFTLLGSSGSGKTTILRIIAGLLAPDAGRVLIADTDVTNVPAYERELAVVFQSLALFPHLTVFDNVAFPLRMRRENRREIRQRVVEALGLVELPDLSGRRVDELSGGQRQRVALARALVYSPRLLLLDEPLSALDRRLRESMELELSRIHRELGVTIVNVTHDQREAMLLSTRIALLEQGQIVQLGTGEELYHRPEQPFVAQFLGDPLLVSGIVSRRECDVTLRTAADELVIATDLPDRSAATLVLRADMLRVAAANEPLETPNALAGEVVFAAFDGSGMAYRVALTLGATVSVHVPARDPSPRLDVGAHVLVGWHPDEAPVIAGDTR